MGKRLVAAPARRLDGPTSTASAAGGTKGKGPASTDKAKVSGNGVATTQPNGKGGARTEVGGAGAATPPPADGDDDNTEPQLKGDALLHHMKVEIATLASTILQDPDNSLQQLRQLREACSHPDTDVGPTICKLAIMSLATVFKDIIPGYRIRELSEKEKTAVVSAAVKQSRDYDASLIRNYQMYLQRLHALVKRGSGKVTFG